LRDAIRRRLGNGLLGAIGTVGIGAASVRVAAAVKDLAVAHRFGTGDSLEAFLLAFALPVFIAGSFRSAFFSAFVPRFLEEEARAGPQGARGALRRAMAVYLVFLAVLAGALALAAGPVAQLLGHAFPPDKRELTRQLIVLLAPFVVLDGTAGMFTAALYARQSYAQAAIVSSIPPLATLAAIFVLSPAWGVEALVAGVLAGAILEAVVSGLLVRRSGLGVRPAIAGLGSQDLALLRGFGLLLVGGIFMSANTVVDQAFAAAAGAGSVASLGYGAKIPAALLGLAGLALGTATLPHYATFVASRRFSEMGASLKRHAIRLTAAGVAIAVPLALLSRPLVRLLFEHGSFVAADTSRVAQIQSYYALQIPGFVAGIVAARCLNAMGRDRVILLVSGLNFVLNVAGDWVLLRFMGLPGIALSTAIVYTVAAAVLLFLCRRAVRQETRRAQTA